MTPGGPLPFHGRGRLRVAQAPSSYSAACNAGAHTSDITNTAPAPAAAAIATAAPALAAALGGRRPRHPEGGLGGCAVLPTPPSRRRRQGRAADHRTGATPNPGPAHHGRGRSRSGQVVELAARAPAIHAGFPTGRRCPSARRRAAGVADPEPVAEAAISTQSPEILCPVRHRRSCICTG